MKLLTAEEQHFLVQAWKQQLREQAILEISFFLKYNLSFISKQHNCCLDTLSINITVESTVRRIEVGKIGFEPYLRTGYILNNSPLAKQETFDTFEQMLREELKRQIKFYEITDKY